MVADHMLSPEAPKRRRRAPMWSRCPDIDEQMADFLARASVMCPFATATSVIPMQIGGRDGLGCGRLSVSRIR